MKLTVMTPSGELYSETLDHIVVSSKNNGDFALFKDHAPLIATIDIGYVKMVKDTQQLFTVIIQGVLEHVDNQITLIAEEAHVGLNKESAMDHLNEVRQERLEENRRRTMDFLRAEKELKKSIREARASNR